MNESIYLMIEFTKINVEKYGHYFHLSKFG